MWRSIGGSVHVRQETEDLPLLSEYTNTSTQHWSRRRVSFIWGLTIFNNGAYLTFKTIFHKGLNLFKFDCEYHAQILSWNQPVLSNEGNVLCSRNQQDCLMGYKFTTDSDF